MSDIRRLFSHLNENNISYVVVGGLAVVLHGHPRLTANVDLVIALDLKNCLAAVHALTAIGYLPRIPVNPNDFADPMVRKKWIEEKGMLVFSMFNSSIPLQLIDIFVDYPLPFEELKAQAQRGKLEGVVVPIAPIAHLIQMKRVSARQKDLEDIAALEILQKNEG